MWFGAPCEHRLPKEANLVGCTARGIPRDALLNARTCIEVYTTMHHARTRMVVRSSGTVS